LALILWISSSCKHAHRLLEVSFPYSEPASLMFSSIFWHQTNARKFSSIAHYTVHQWLNLPRGTLVSRYLRIVLAFLSSGFMHLLDDFASGVKFQDSGAMRFFIAQGLGMVIEDIFYKKYRSSTTVIPKNISRVLGYVWVSLYLTWTVPAYIYPMMWRTNQGFNDSTIPFTFFGSSAERTNAFVCLLGVGFVALSGSLIPVEKLAES